MPLSVYAVTKRTQEEMFPLESTSMPLPVTARTQCDQVVQCIVTQLAPLI
jgi:hypothetical protein